MVLWLSNVIITVYFHRTEVAELRRLLELGRVPSSSIGASSNGANNHNFHSSLEEATELEYLRNILFEFMMGRQTAVSRTTLVVLNYNWH